MELEDWTWRSWKVWCWVVRTAWEDIKLLVGGIDDDEDDGEDLIDRLRSDQCSPYMISHVLTQEHFQM